MKIDIPGGSDYNNYITYEFAGSPRYMYYHRGPSPSVFEGGDTYSTSLQDFVYNPQVPVPISPVGTPSYNDGLDVGAIDNTSILVSGSYIDRKVAFSNSGPAVEIYAAGDGIISAVPDDQGFSYYYDTSGKQSKKSGTSMAAPQVCGMMACILQAHPDWTPKQVKNYLIANSQPLMYDTSSDDDFISSASLHGGNNRIAHLPMNGSKQFNYGNVV